MHDVPCHQVCVWQFYMSIWCLQPRLTIPIDDDVALLVFFNLHVAEALAQHSHSTLEAAYHYEKQAERLTVGEDGWVHNVGDDDFMRKHDTTHIFSHIIKNPVSRALS